MFNWSKFLICSILLVFVVTIANSTTNNLNNLNINHDLKLNTASKIKSYPTHNTHVHTHTIHENIKSTTVPDFVYLYAPYTPFLNNSNFSLNTAVIPELAQAAASLGINTVWVGGSMGQFDTMTVDERNSLVKAWIDANNEYNLNFYIIYQIGSTVLSDSLKMARYANSIGASAIASVPPFYEIPDETDFSMIFYWFNSMIDASNNMDFWFYHIPGTTGYNIDIYNFINAAVDSNNGMPGLTGIKYVDTSNNQGWFESVRDFGNKIHLLWAPEPKLQCFGLGMGNGTVLAEDFYARTFRCMKYYYENEMYNEMYNQQMWKINISSIFNQYGGASAERCVYQQLANVSIGPPRPPQAAITQATCDTVLQELNQANFFDDIFKGC